MKNVCKQFKTPIEKTQRILFPPSQPVKNQRTEDIFRIFYYDILFQKNRCLAHNVHIGTDATTSTPPGTVVMTSAPLGTAATTFAPPGTVVTTPVPPGTAVKTSAPSDTIVTTSVPRGTAAMTSAPPDTVVMTSAPPGTTATTSSPF